VDNPKRPSRSLATDVKARCETKSRRSLINSHLKPIHEENLLDGKYDVRVIPSPIELQELRTPYQNHLDSNPWFGSAPFSTAISRR